MLWELELFYCRKVKMELIIQLVTSPDFSLHLFAFLIYFRSFSMYQVETVSAQKLTFTVFFVSALEGTANRHQEFE